MHTGINTLSSKFPWLAAIIGGTYLFGVALMLGICLIFHISEYGPMGTFFALLGILVAIFQAVTQIHEQSLAFILKLIVVVLVLLVGGGWMLETLLDFSRYLFTLM